MITKAAKAYAMITAALAAGKTIRIHSHTRITEVTPRLAAAFEKNGTPVFTLESDELLLRSGKRKDRVIVKNSIFCSITTVG